MTSLTERKLCELMLDSAEDRAEHTHILWAGYNAIQPKSPATVALKMVEQIEKENQSYWQSRLDELGDEG